jgi:hypothetical protein
MSREEDGREERDDRDEEYRSWSGDNMGELSGTDRP